MSFCTLGFSTGRGIFDSQGMSGDGGWTALAPSTPCATSCMVEVHLSHTVTGGFSRSGVTSGLPGAGSCSSPGSARAEVATVLVEEATVPTLASLLAASWVMVPCVRVIALGVEKAEDFLDGPGELVDDFLDATGDPAAVLLRLLLLSMTTLSGLGSKRKRSATLGDSVSLKAKSSVSVCLEALITSTHFSVHIAASRNFVGPLGSSTSLKSPTPIERTSFSSCGLKEVLRSLPELLFHALSSSLSTSFSTTMGWVSSSLHSSPTSITNGLRFSSPTWQPASTPAPPLMLFSVGPCIASSSTFFMAFCSSGQPMISSSVLNTASWIRDSSCSLVNSSPVGIDGPELLATVLTPVVLVPWLIFLGVGGDRGGGSVLLPLSRL